MKRRSFLAASSAALFAPGMSAAEKGAKRRVAVIGHTGRGNYGHGLDTVWQHVPGVEIVGVADGNSSGLLKAVRRLKTDRGYKDYRRLLDDRKPEFVSICTRHPDQHCEMALAAIEAGVKGIYMEKPFCRTPAEADQLVAACRKSGAKIAVAHRNRYHPVLPFLKHMLWEFGSDGIGKLLEIRGRGKGDHRGGGEDLWVLGSHVMNLMNYFGGDPVSCSAVVKFAGEQVSPLEVEEGAEGLGLLAGDEVHARFSLSDGVTATFDSMAHDATRGHGFGLQVIGSEGVVHIHCDRDPVAHFVKGNPFEPPEKPRPWIPISSAGVAKRETEVDLIEKIKNHVHPVMDLIAACDEGWDPSCDVMQGAMTVEMISAVFASHVAGSRAVTFPLKERKNPLAEWQFDPIVPEPPVPEPNTPDLPVVKPVPGKPGFYYNPWTGKVVDLRAIPPGTLVRDPNDDDPRHRFRVPEPPGKFRVP